MSRTTLQHPTDTTLEATYGWDRAIEFYVEVRQGRRLVAEYDATRPGYRDLQGVLEVLADHRFFAPEDIEYAHTWLRVVLPDEIDDEGARRAAHVMQNLRGGANV